MSSTVIFSATRRTIWFRFMPEWWMSRSRLSSCSGRSRIERVLPFRFVIPKEYYPYRKRSTP